MPFDFWGLPNHAYRPASEISGTLEEFLRREPARSNSPEAQFFSLVKLTSWRGTLRPETPIMNTDQAPPPRPRCRSLLGVKIIGTGGYVPDLVITNQHLKEKLGCDSDWIVKRTGILERRHALPHQATSDLCYEAAQRCLDNAGLTAADIDLILVATFSPDMGIPSTACILQDRLQAHCNAMEIHSACSGFVYALVTGAAYVLSGASERALIVGGDCNSRAVNPNDMKTYPLFGDGGGAVLLTRGEPHQGLLSYSLGVDGSGGQLLSQPACGSRMPPTPELIERGMHYVHMDGRAVFRWGVSILCDSIQDVLKASGLQPGDIDFYMPHQANIRIINAATDVLHIPRSKVRNNIEKYGNTSAASIPLVLNEACAEGIIKPGHKLLFSGFGAGLSWGTTIFQW
jgi:3-oxoacyl-[acyl-carrier-protein] synthase III